MVTVTYILLVIPYFVHGANARAQDPIAPEVILNDYYNANDYGAAATYPDYYYTTDYGRPTVTYGDYAKSYYADYYSQYTDFAYNDYDYYQYYEDYGPAAYDDDYIHEYGEYFGFGDRNNPMDTALGLYDEAGLSSQVPWVYIIVPVLQVDLYYVDDEQKGIENIDLELPIETFLFELGDFGLGHLELGDFGLGDLDLEHLIGNYGAVGNYDYAAPYDYAYEDFPIYGHYPTGSKPQMFDTADQLADAATMDYPGVDYQPMWVDWIFMVPPENGEPVVR